MFTYKEALELKKQCELELQNNSRRSHKRNLNSKRKQRNDTSLVQWQKVKEIDKTKAKYKDWTNWAESNNYQEE